MRVRTVGGTSSFSYVATKGSGLTRAVRNRQACFLLTAWDKSNRIFDQGRRQKAYFRAVLVQNKVRFVADIQYLPASSTHRVCYTPPSSGPYTLLVRLLYTNTAALLGRKARSNARSFAFYTQVLKSTIQVATGPVRGGTRGVFAAYRASLPVCTLRTIHSALNNGFWVRDTWYPRACKLPRLEPREALQCLNGKKVLVAGDSQMRFMFGLLQVCPKCNACLFRIGGSLAWISGR